MVADGRFRRCLLITAIFVLQWAIDIRAEEEQRRLFGFLPEAGTTEKKFGFAVWGDPQVAWFEPGRPGFDSSYYRSIQDTVNPRFRQSVELTNRLNPAFTITLGDNVHGNGEWEHYQVFLDLVKPLRSPLFMIMGNHDHVPRIDHLPGSPRRGIEFGNFLLAQERTGGIPKAVYSFDAGEWHFVLFSQPGGSGSGVSEAIRRHPEFLDWMAKDLKENRHRPTMFFTHHPLLPLGRNQQDLYGPSASIRREFMDLLLRYGNVKYVFYGHAHNTVASIPLTSWRYRGTAFILLPNTAFFTRDYFYQERTKSSWGVGWVEVEGQECRSIEFRTLAGETIPIRPQTFEEYNDSIYGYLTPDWALPASPDVRNGSFEMPLTEGWRQNHLLPYESPPVQKRDLLSDDAANQGRYLYLYTKAMDAYGPFRANYIVSEVRQALVPPEMGKWPVLELRYRIRSAEYRHPDLCAAYIMVSGHKRERDDPVFTAVYGLGGSVHFYGAKDPYGSIALNPVLDRWEKLSLDPRSDFRDTISSRLWEQDQIDNIVLRLGVHNQNYWKEGIPAEIGVSFDDIVWISSAHSPEGKADSVQDGTGSVESGFRLE